MFDASRLLGGLVGGALPGTASKVLKHANRQGGASSFLAGAAVPGGVLGLLGGLAVAAYDHYSEQQQKTTGAGAATPPPPPGARQTPPPAPGAANADVGRTMPPPPPGAAQAPPHPSTPEAPTAPANSATDTDQAQAMVLIQAMIAAAKADGEVDADESRRILGKLEEAGASVDERAWVMAELTKPLDVEALVAQVREPTLAVQVYAASLLAIDIDTEAERHYLSDLQERLRIEQATVSQIHEALNVPTV